MPLSKLMSFSPKTVIPGLTFEFPGKPIAVGLLTIVALLLFGGVVQKIDGPAVFQWLGKLHPAAVDFPIAMLIAAAVAEWLLIVTDEPLFDAAARFCVWFGVVMTVVGALLGWLFGGFQLTDDEWILTLHRWLGTSMAVWAIYILVLSERTHRTGCVHTQQRYRYVLFVGALLVSITGFFGGAMIYGLDHYAW